jgi:catechol 2,3-dioxygenase-like lactoylglutathione lyase family enzyme
MNVTRLVREFLAMGAMVLVASASNAALADKSAPTVNTVGAIINVSNLDRSLNFYTRLIGLKEAARVPLGPGAWEVILTPDGSDLSSQLVLVSQAKQGGVLEQGNAFNRIVLFAHTADDVDDVTKRVGAEGYKIVVPVGTVPIPGARSYHFTHFKDPDGYTVEMMWFDPNIRVPKGNP